MLTNSAVPFTGFIVLVTWLLTNQAKRLRELASYMWVEMKALWWIERGEE